MNSMTTGEERSATAVGAPREKGHRWFAALYDRMNRAEERGFLGEMRKQLLGDLTGDVLEIGAGTGANFTHYPPTVHVTALEPDPFMLKRAAKKLTALGRTNIALQQAPSERLPFDDATFDVVVSTFVLCTVRDLPRALVEIRRVLKPGGRLYFIEHVRSKGFGGRVQDLIKPIWGWCSAGCHPNRSTLEALRAAGFDVDIMERRMMLSFVPIIRGTAVVASPGD